VHHHDIATTSWLVGNHRGNCSVGDMRDLSRFNPFLLQFVLDRPRNQSRNPYANNPIQTKVTMTPATNSNGVQWPAPGSEDTELGVFMGPEVSHGEAKIYARVQT
jgi:hypothetical protein